MNSDPEAPVCQFCGDTPAVRYHQNTKYVDEDRNWVTLCADCQKENDEYWAGMWAGYYADCL